MDTQFNTRKPVPTEFLGTKMRSKSEAIFAACLHFAGWKTEYEPRWRRISDFHLFDFLAHRPYCAWTRDVYIEYKPAMPTMSYVRNLIEKIRPFAKRCEYYNCRSWLDCFLVWGSPFCNDWDFNHIEYSPFVCYPLFTSLGRHGWGEYDPTLDGGEDHPFSFRHKQTEIFGIQTYHIEKAMSYRFDLQH